jgi:hypothetical protein
MQIKTGSPPEADVGNNRDLLLLCMLRMLRNWIRKYKSLPVEINGQAFGHWLEPREE